MDLTGILEALTDFFTVLELLTVIIVVALFVYIFRKRKKT